MEPGHLFHSALICPSSADPRRLKSRHPFVHTAQQLISLSDNNIRVAHRADHKWNKGWADNPTKLRIFIPDTGIHPPEWPSQEKPESGLTASAPVSDFSAHSCTSGVWLSLQPVSAGQWYSNRGPRSNFHWKENLTLQSFKRIFIEIINSCGREGFLKDKCGLRAKTFEHHWCGTKEQRVDHVVLQCPIHRQPARPDGSRRWDNPMATQHLPQDLVRPRIRVRQFFKFQNPTPVQNPITRDQYGSGLKPILAGLGLDRTTIF